MRQKLVVKILSVIIIVFAVGRLHANQYLKLYYNDTIRIQSFDFDNVRKIMFVSDTLKIHENGISDVSLIAFDDIKKIIFQELISVGIEEKINTNIKIVYQPSIDCVEIESSSIIKEVRIFDVKGLLVAYFSPCTNAFQESLSSLPKGVYIVCANDEKTYNVKKISIR